jgi:hypothetical protein
MKDKWLFWLVILIKETFLNQISCSTFNQKGQTKKNSSKWPWLSQINHTK